MKIRILGNSIRLRLTQSEVTTFLEKGIVEQVTRFGADERHHLTYALQITDDKIIHAIFDHNKITVFVPQSQGDNWAQSSDISLENQSQISPDEHLKILVEKDFKCLTDRVGEDESDMFPNPEIDTLKC